MNRNQTVFAKTFKNVYEFCAYFTRINPNYTYSCNDRRNNMLLPYNLLSITFLQNDIIHLVEANSNFLVKINFSTQCNEPYKFELCFILESSKLLNGISGGRTKKKSVLGISRTRTNCPYAANCNFLHSISIKKNMYNHICII